MKAALVRTLPQGPRVGEWRGHAALYRCEPGGPLPELVIVSAVRNALVHETFVFAADESGNVTDWMELEGSYRGGIDHGEALRGAGYEVSP